MSDDSSDSLLSTPSPHDATNKAEIEYLNTCKLNLRGNIRLAETARQLLMHSQKRYDPSLFNTDICSILSSNDDATVRIGLQAVSVLFKTTPSLLIHLAPVLQRLVARDRMIVHVLRMLSNVITKEVYDLVITDALVNHFDGHIRKLCLHVTFALYMRDPSVELDLFGMAKQALFDAPLNGLSVLVEIAFNNPQLVLEVYELLLGLFPYANFVCFSKICRIMAILLDHGASIAESLVIELNSLLQRKRLPPEFYICIADVARKIRKDLPGADDLLKTVGRNLEDVLLTRKIHNGNGRILSPNSDTSHWRLTNTQFVALEALLQIEDRYSVSSRTLFGLNLSDPMARALVCQRVTPDVKSLEMMASELVTPSNLGSYPYFVKMALEIAPRAGAWFVHFIWEFHRINGVDLKLIRRALTTLTDKTLELAFMREVRYQELELPDNDFGIGLAEILAKVSENAEDMETLIPITIAQKSPEFQSAILDNAMQFLMRLGTGLNGGMRHRVQILCFSKHREVRVRAAELLSLSDML